MYNFSRNMNDYNYILSEYDRLKNIYTNRIFIYNNEQNLIDINLKKVKYNWGSFYKNISKSNDKDVIIKCDDDILFIDMISLKYAILDRINDKIPFIIHSNCINNGVCTYYQKDIFSDLKIEIDKYPTGGILGILFEKPEIAYIIHNKFTMNILSNINNLKHYFINSCYITSRISINFILINGSDAKYLSDITTDDEYEVSGFIPELLERPNKINGKLITSHLSYSFQDKIILNRHDIYNNYLKIKNNYINNITNYELNLNNCNYNYNYSNSNNIYIPKSHISNIDNNVIYKIKNWYNSNNYYIKLSTSNKYLAINYDTDQLYITENNNEKTSFEIIYKENNYVEIKLGIYNLTRHNCTSNIRNETLFIKYFRDNKEKEIFLENDNNNSKNNSENNIENNSENNIENNIDKNDNDSNNKNYDNNNNNNFYIKFPKYNCYLILNSKNKLEIIEKNINTFENYKIENKLWSFEKVHFDDYIYCSRFIKNKKIYYKNIETNQVYTNYYKGWGLENVLW